MPLSMKRQSFDEGLDRMPYLTADTDRWLVSARVGGEVLTTRASVKGLELDLLGPVEGFAPAELESWLQSLAQSVAEGVAEVPPGDPVPPMLREALGGLLFSRAEVWNRGTPPCAIALVAGEERIGFGWVGEASVQVILDGARLDSEWVSIRDPQGREARAWCGSPRHDVRIELSWSPGPAQEPVSIEVRWNGAVAISAAASEMASIDERLPAPEAVEPAASMSQTSSVELSPPEGEAPSSGVARWLAQHLQWDRPETSVGESSPTIEEPVEAEAALPELIPPTPEPAEVTDASIRPDTPEALEPIDPTPGAAAQGTAEPPIDRIPSEALDAMATPEPEALREPERRRPPPRHPQWPEPPEDEASPLARRWKPIALWSAVVLALFGIGWFVGSMQEQSGPEQTRRPSGLVLFLRRVGLAPPRFEVAVTSRPPGAWIAIDGKELSVRTPATLELAPGEHRVELSFPDLGSAAYRVTGGKGDRVSLDAPLWGSLEVIASESRAQVEVSLDGQSIGFVPIRLDSVAPGPHELRFTAGSTAWGSTIEVRVGEAREVLAYPLQSPATGLLQVRATQSEDGETTPLEGARVWVDGVSRGVTPLTLELSRGPHSVRVVHQREVAPIQVIDLPGGNQRFATFDFGLRSDLPELTLKAPPLFTVDEPGLVSATLNEIGTAEVREMWLHVRTPENRWRRYPMTLLDAQGSVVGAAPFPIALLAEDGQQLYYVSALTTQGDEIFTEMQTARGPATARR